MVDMVDKVPEGGNGRARRKVGGTIIQIREADPQENLVFGCFVRGDWEVVLGDGCVLEVPADGVRTIKDRME